MCSKGLVCVLIVLVTSKLVRPDDFTAQNEIMDTNYSGNQMNYENRQENDNVPGSGPIDNGYAPQQVGESWLDTAKNALNGPTGQIVVHMAKEMISRSTGNSQVYSFDKKLP